MKLGWNEIWLVRIHKAPPPVKRLCNRSAFLRRLKRVMRGMGISIIAITLMMFVSTVFLGGTPDFNFALHPYLSSFAAIAMGLSFLMGPVFIGVCLWLIVLNARTHRRLRASQCVLCPCCEHDLNGLGEEGKCPECGEPFTRPSLDEAWSMLLPRFHRRLRKEQEGSAG